MADQLIEKIQDLSLRFRRAIEATAPASLPVTFHRFPSGACGDATALLGQYLIDNGIEPVEYICGLKGGRSHAWVRVGDIVADITADQFPDVNEPVIVTRDLAWHQKYRIDQAHAGGVDVYNDFASAVLRSAYERVLQNLPD
jgi:hypothetical protein